MSRKSWIGLVAVGVLVVVGLVLAFTRGGGPEPLDEPQPAVASVEPSESPAVEVEVESLPDTEVARPPWEVDVVGELDALPRLLDGPLPLTQDPVEFAQALILYTQGGDWSQSPSSREETVAALREACIPEMPALDEIAHETGVTREAMCEWAIELLLYSPEQWQIGIELERVAFVDIVEVRWEIYREVRALDASAEVRAALSRDLNRSHFGGSINVTYGVNEQFIDPDTGELFDEPFFSEWTTGIMVACPRDESGCRLVTALEGGF